MEHVVAGVDGSAAAIAALTWASDLCARAGARLTAVRVFDAARAELPSAADVDQHDQQLHELQEWCRSLPAGRPAPEAVLEVPVDGHPADGLLAASRDRDADLLVVGGRGAGGFPHLHLGSVAHHLAHQPALPLAIISTTGAEPVRRIVVGCDGSTGAGAAVDFVGGLAGALGVPVTAVYAFEPMVEWVPENDPSSWHRRAEAEVGEWTAAIMRSGVGVKVDVERDAHPVAAISRALQAEPGSVAVVGTRGAGGFNGLRVGRVPLQLVHNTGAAVIMVPAATR
jgi:nucleotide-binding universal stress UspA family protein